MFFVLTEEQKALKELVQKFGEKYIKPVINELEERGEFPHDIFKGLSDLSLMGMRVPEKYQGGGLDFSTYALVMEEIAWFSLSVAVGLSVTGLLQSILAEFGSEEQKKKFLPSLARGEKIGAFSLTESGSGSDAANLKTTAAKKKDFYCVDGSKAFVTNGKIADVYVVFVRTSPNRAKGISALLIEKGTEGFLFGREEDKMALKSSPTVELIFRNCKVPEWNLIGKEGDGFHIAMQALNSGRITIGASSVGLALRAFEEARDYSKMRKQFGKTLSQFQAIQMMFADMAAAIEYSRLLVQKAAYLKDHQRDFSSAAAMAKMVASDTAMNVTTKAVQIFGGNGYCQDYPVERFMREAKVLQIVEGTNQIQKLVIAKRVLHS